MKANVFVKKRYLLCIFLALLFLFPFLPFGRKEGDRYALKASAAGSANLEVSRYIVEMTVLPSRDVKVEEEITVTFLRSGLTMFFRSLPTDGCRYAEIEAHCAGNEDFSFDVIDNPDTDGFIDVECIGGAERGNTWTYEISYLMTPSKYQKNGMIIDVVGFGWMVPLRNVTAIVHFPDALTSQKVYVGGYGEAQGDSYQLSSDKRTLTVQKDLLDIVYNDYYGEEVAEGVTVQFTLPDGALQGYARSQIFTAGIGALLLCAALLIGGSLAMVLLRKKRELITVVSVKPPEDMSPLQMGKTLDGKVDEEDITSMIYYFAHKGYLKIDMKDEKDPFLIRVVETLPDDAPAHEKALFKGLFAKARHNFDAYGVYVSKMAEGFYETIDKVKAQVRAPKPMYTGQSKFFLGLITSLCILFGFLGGMLMGFRVGGGYLYTVGVFFALPVGINCFLLVTRENYRYKWKTGKRVGFFLLEVVISAIFTAIFTAFSAEHIMTVWERGALCIGTLLPMLLAQNVLARTENYLDRLGSILGFKDFIVVTEEEKIKVMLEENPELYYDVLPYAQVLGVTNEWEEKFAKLAVDPPDWYVGEDFTLFDYMLINRCMTRAMTHALAEAAKEAGSRVGGSGGGRGFGGFGGGGFGGGGGGAR